MNLKTLASALLLTTLSATALADEALINREDVQQYINKTAIENGFTPEEIAGWLLDAQAKPNIIGILDKPSTSRPWHEFEANFVNKTRINNGATFWRENAILIGDISRKYQVAPEVLLAILGAETNYGRYTGTFRIVDALSTIAFNYPRRAEYFQGELTQLFLLAREEKQDPMSFKGSYAGAMGWPQFMPSSFRKWAQDWDKDGKHDIWTNPGDAMASVANYLNQHGWQDGGDTYTVVNFNGSAKSLLDDKFNLHYTVNELIAKGVAPISEINPRQKAVLFALETEPDFTQYFLGFNNFYVITRYNKSTLYATAVLKLAEEIKNAYVKNNELVQAEPEPAKNSSKKLR
ncbi:lytic murein transglycosylase B [Chitinibacter sp. S2-10]|uniref:lytic murein transglycosylase B n=1 Tax=Chitinibacter sp. S2-10 TaxID=3373597 RepID=UPI003977C5E9